MRILDFVVDKQIITKSKTCDFSGLVAGSRGHLRARFMFSKEWAGYKKVAVFTGGGKEVPVPITAGVVSVPDDVVLHGSFKVTVVGKRGDEVLPCNTVTVIQRRR